MEMQKQLQPSASNKARRISLSGFHLLNSPLLNKGTAFSDHERDIFGLHGLLPPHVGSLDEQIDRRIQAFREQPNSFHKYSFLRDLQNSNETLFYALLLRNIEEMLPVVYTPTVGEGCQRFSEIWHGECGLRVNGLSRLCGFGPNGTRQSQHDPGTSRNGQRR